MAKVSVIIPIYNTEKYLKECLNSVINQSLVDIEIICINDGSTDNSIEILNEFKKQDGRISVISQDNQGQAVARNKGLSLANGEYIYFMDSDDILDLTALEEVYSLSKENDLDLIIFKLINFKNSLDDRYTSNYYEMDFLKPWRNKIFNYQDLWEKSLDIAVSPPGKLFKKDLIENIKCPEGLIFEDNVFFANAMLDAKRVYFYDKHLYNRRRHDSSTTVSNNMRFADTITIMNMVMDLCKNYGVYKKFQVGLWNKKISTSYYRYLSVGEEFKEEFFNFIKKDFIFFKNEYDEYDMGNKLNQKLNYIYQAVLSSNNHKIFELQVKIFDLEEKNNELKNKCSNLENKNDELKNHIKVNMNKQKLLLNSNSWKLTKPLRYFNKFF